MRITETAQGKTIINVVPIGLIANWSVHDLYTFFHAYLTPQKTLLITINDFGEANFELFFSIYAIVLVSIWFFYIYQKVVK